MNKENIIRLVKQFKSENYKDLFSAIIIFEKLEDEYFYNEELESLEDSDIKFLEDIYDKFMESDIPGLLNEELKEIIEG